MPHKIVSTKQELIGSLGQKKGEEIVPLYDGGTVALRTVHFGRRGLRRQVKGDVNVWGKLRAIFLLEASVHFLTCTRSGIAHDRALALLLLFAFRFVVFGVK